MCIWARKGPHAVLNTVEFTAEFLPKTGLVFAEHLTSQF